MNEYGTLRRKHWPHQTSEPHHGCGVGKARVLDLMMAMQYLVQYNTALSVRIVPFEWSTFIVTRRGEPGRRSGRLLMERCKRCVNPAAIDG